MTVDFQLQSAFLFCREHDRRPQHAGRLLIERQRPQDVGSALVFFQEPDAFPGIGVRNPELRGDRSADQSIAFR